MLKKIHKSQSDLSPQDSLHCFLCRKHSSRRNLFVCSSGHIVCEHCQSVDNIKEGGDRNECVVDNDCIPIKKCISSKNLASGDFNEPSKHSRIKQRLQKKLSFSEVKDESNNVAKEEHDFETTIHFKNPNYMDSGTSVHSQLDDVLKRPNKYPDCTIPQRPIMCPEAQCSKIVAIDSVLLHFYFDHSKVPRLSLMKGFSEQIVLNTANMTTETKCFGIFTIQNENRQIPEELLSDSPLKEQNPLLMLVVRRSSETLQVKSAKIDSVLLRNAWTQTDPSNVNLKNQHKPGVANMGNMVNAKDIVGGNENQFNDNDHFMIWLCKLDNSDHVYNVTLSKEDNKLSFSYTGEASHLRNKQDAYSVYHRSDCLIIRGIAANKLIDDKGQMNVFLKLL